MYPPFMNLEYRKLSPDEIEAALQTTGQWGIENGKLTRTFEFSSYLEGPDFSQIVARIAEDLNHHPDILIGYRKVTISVNTHDVDGISPYDFELARRIDAISAN